MLLLKLLQAPTFCLGFWSGQCLSSLNIVLFLFFIISGQNHMGSNYLCYLFIIMNLQALLMGDGSNIYGSRNLFDQYRDMRLDIDNMSYEVIF